MGVLAVLRSKLKKGNKQYKSLPGGFEYWTHRVFKLRACVLNDPIFEWDLNNALKVHNFDVFLLLSYRGGVKTRSVYMRYIQGTQPNVPARTSFIYANLLIA